MQKIGVIFNMLFQRKDLPELYFIKHRFDTNDNYVDYESKILNNSLSPYIYKNDVMNTWLNKMQPIVAAHSRQRLMHIKPK